MPIYAYKCESCGHRQDILRKLSDPVLSTCPACGAEAFAKQVTAAGFQLKGSGWYVTDFRNNAGKGAVQGDKTDKSEPAAKPAEGAQGQPPATPEAAAPGKGAESSADTPATGAAPPAP